MKLSDCNARQRKAFLNIYHASSWLLGGLENVLLDYSENSPEYKDAKQKLSNHAGLVQELYNMAITDLYGEDGVSFGSDVELYLKDIRFCGKEWLMERCEARIKKAGY